LFEGFVEKKIPKEVSKAVTSDKPILPTPEKLTLQATVVTPSKPAPITKQEENTFELEKLKNEVKLVAQQKNDFILKEKVDQMAKDDLQAFLQSELDRETAEAAALAARQKEEMAQEYPQYL
jgi:hypothetical protein